MRRFAAVCALAGATLFAPDAAMAEPSLTAAQKLCEAQGGTFSTGAPYGTIYSCYVVPNDLSDAQVATATRLCENLYAGRLEFTAAVRYSCYPA